MTTIMFEGGGPAQGVFRSISHPKDEVRVATPELLQAGEAAFYAVESPAVIGPGHKGAVARFVGVRPCAASLLDLMVPGD